MNRTARLVVLVTALASLLGIMSSAACAVTWHNTGSTSFTATGGPMTISRGGVNFACAGSSGTGTAAGGSTVTQHYDVTGNITYNCAFLGQAMNIRCHYRFTNATQPVVNVTSGSATVTCVMQVTASSTNVCHIEGSTPGTYINPSGSGAGRVTFPASTTLTFTNSTAACPVGAGSAGITHQTITVTNGSPTTLGPVITRTA